MRVSLALLAFLFGLACCGCSNLFYFPSHAEYAHPSVPYTEVRIPTADGLELSGWLFAPRGETLGTVVQFHGNAGNITSHFRSLAWLTTHGYALLTFDYRGYGSSPGTPSQAGLERDALAAIHFAQELPRGSAEPDLVLYGQSLGGAVLLHAYASVRDRTRIRALVVESSFHSYEEAAASVLFREPLLFPFTGFGYALVSDAYAPADKVASVAPTPLLVIHGDKDPVLPPSFGVALYRLAREPRELWLVPGGGHADAMRRPAYRTRLLEYLRNPLKAHGPRLPVARKPPAALTATSACSTPIR